MVLLLCYRVWSCHSSVCSWVHRKFVRLGQRAGIGEPCLIEVGDAVARALVLSGDGHAHPVVVALQLVVAPPHESIPNVHCSVCP